MSVRGGEGPGGGRGWGWEVNYMCTGIQACPKKVCLTGTSLITFLSLISSIIVYNYNTCMISLFDTISVKIKNQRYFQFTSHNYMITQTIRNGSKTFENGD